MCIMFVKECDKDFPSHETMKVCWDDNRDGAGYAWYNEESEAWKVVKGLMSWNEFLQRFEEDRKTYELDDKLVCVHFRVGTTGPNTGGATHPFPFIDVTPENIHKTEYETKGIMFHNGTLSNGTVSMSDTAMAAMQYWHIVPHIFETGETNQGLLKILEEVLNSKVCRYAICYENHLIMLGPWVKDEESGLMYSNERFVAEKTWRYKAQQRVKEERAKADARQASFEKGDTQYLRMPKDVRTYTKFVGTDNVWNWELWDNRYKTKKPVLGPTEDLGKAKSFDVMDMDGNTLFTVDADEDFDKGDIVDVTPTESGIICITCQNHVKDRSYLIEGECPGCGTLLDPEWSKTYPAESAVDDNMSAAVDAALSEEEEFDYRDVYQCPTCKETSYIVDVDEDKVPHAYQQKDLSDFTKCNKCSCVWGYTNDDKEWVLGFQNEHSGSIGFQNSSTLPQGNTKDEVQLKGGSKI